MEKVLRFLAPFVAGSIMYSCGPVLYSNVGQNVPLFQEKGEFTGQLSYSNSDGAWVADGVGLQGAYAISDKVGVISSFYSLKGVENEDDEWEGKGSYFEIGGGIFHGNPDKKFSVEGYAGFGTGSIKNSSKVDFGTSLNLKYLKPFIQPSIGFTTKYFDMALTPRISYLSVTSGDDKQFILDGEPINSGEFIDEIDQKVMFEPGILIRGGFPQAKLEIQYNFSTLKEPSENYYLLNNEFISIGLRFLISGRFAEKE
ncbi:MAG TPA: hypothetical protein VLA71_05325 [Algoriphagus sp.]|nr:hypothetical protein [Algoriphagus sp.]